MFNKWFLFRQVATFIVQKILLDDVGLDYICTTAERFLAVGRVLGNMVAALAENPSSRLLKHIIRCYLRLTDNLRSVLADHFICQRLFVFLSIPSSVIYMLWMCVLFGPLHVGVGFLYH